MKGQPNPFTQIFVGVATAVLTAFLIYHLVPSPTPTSKPVEPNSIVKNVIDPQPVYNPQEKSYITASITDGLTINQYGYGQIAESVTIEINGNIQYINLSAMNGKTSGSVRFKLPKDGFYNYEVKATTTFNNHEYDGQQCTHNDMVVGKFILKMDTFTKLC